MRVVHRSTAGGDNHANLPVSCLTWGFPYDYPAKMPGEGALNATTLTYPSKGAALPVGCRQRGDQIAARAARARPCRTPCSPRQQPSAHGTLLLTRRRRPLTEAAPRNALRRQVVCEGDKLFERRQLPYCGMSTNRENIPWNATVIVSVGPLRCFATIRSASP